MTSLCQVSVVATATAQKPKTLHSLRVSLVCSSFVESMGRAKIKSLVTSFSPDGEFLAILSPDGNVKIWNTGSGTLFAEWKDPYGDSLTSYSCIACSSIGKKKKGKTLLLALGMKSGDILAVNIFNGEKKWTSEGCHIGGATTLLFTGKGRSLYTAGSDGIVCALDSKTGETQGTFKASKKPIASLALSSDERFLAVGSDKIRVFNVENRKEVQKFSAGSDIVQYVAASDGGNAFVSSGSGEKQLHVWEHNQENKSATLVAVLSMRYPPIMLECRNKDEGLVVLSVSEAGIAYVWDLTAISQAEVTPSTIVAKSAKAESNQQKSAKKNSIPVIAARLRDLDKAGLISVIVAYGSSTDPRFYLMEVTDPGEELVISTDEILVPEMIVGSQEIGDLGAKDAHLGLHDLKLEETVVSEKKRLNKKRAASDQDLASPRNHVNSGNLEGKDGPGIEYDPNEPTMGEKLMNLNLLDEPTTNSLPEQDPSLNVKPPSADSVHVLLKQALHADDRALLLDCLYTRDEKVIANSTSLLNPSDVLKFLNLLISLTQSRGSILVCAIPWLRSLLIQHASGIMSQESSLHALNSLYQLIESRVSTFGSALQLSSCLDYLLAGITENVTEEENDAPLPIIYEVMDDSDEESEDAMETNGASEVTDEEVEELEPSGDVLHGLDSEVSDDMSE